MYYAWQRYFSFFYFFSVIVRTILLIKKDLSNRTVVKMEDIHPIEETGMHRTNGKRRWGKSGFFEKFGGDGESRILSPGVFKF